MKANQKFVQNRDANVQTLFGALVIVAVGVALAPVVAGLVADANVSGMSSGAQALFNLIPLFYIVLLVIIVVGFIRFRQVGG